MKAMVILLVCPWQGYGVGFASEGRRRGSPTGNGACALGEYLAVLRTPVGGNSAQVMDEPIGSWGVKAHPRRTVDRETARYSSRWLSMLITFPV